MKNFVYTFSKIILISGFLFFGLYISITKVDAAVAEKKHERIFTVEDEYMSVKEVKTTTINQPGYLVSQGSLEGFTIFNPIPGDPSAVDKLQDTLNSILITDSQGNELTYEIDDPTATNYLIKVQFPRSVTYGNSETITLTYKSYGLLINTGAIKDIYIPGFPSNYQFETDSFEEVITTQLVMPDDLPEINVFTPKEEILTQGNNKIVNYPQEDLLGASAWIQLGTEQFFTFEIKQTIPATSEFPFALNTFSMPLPRDIQSGPIAQDVHYTYIYPEPESITLDRDGNLIAKFRESSIKEIEITVRGYATLKKDVNYEFTSAGLINEIPDSLQPYLTPASYWEVDNTDIQSTAKEIKGNETDVFKILQSTYDFVVNKIDYSFVKKYGLNERKGAVATLNGDAAVCMEYSDLFITLLRASGVPARAAFGYGFGPGDYEAKNEKTINHQWAEVYLPEKESWIAVDTTWGEFGDQIIGGDLNHFYSHVASVDPETPSTSEIAYFGQLNNIPEREMNIDIIANLYIDPEANAYSQEDLLEKYSARAGLQSISYNFSKITKILDSSIEYNISKTLNTDSQEIIDFVKLLLYSVPIILVATLFYIKIFRTPKFRKVKL